MLRREKVSNINLNEKEWKYLNIAAVCILAILLLLDIVYKPTSENIDLTGCVLGVVAIFLGFITSGLYANLLTKTKEAEKLYKYGMSYVIIAVIEIIVIVFRMGDFVLANCKL